MRGDIRGEVGAHPHRVVAAPAPDADPSATAADPDATAEGRATVRFVGPAGHDVPAEALRRIVGLIIDQAARLPGSEAS